MYLLYLLYFLKDCETGARLYHFLSILVSLFYFSFFPIFFFFLFFSFWVLWIKIRTFHMLGKDSTTQLHCQPSLCLSFTLWKDNCLGWSSTHSVVLLTLNLESSCLGPWVVMIRGLLPGRLKNILNSYAVLKKNHRLHLTHSSYLVNIDHWKTAEDNRFKCLLKHLVHINKQGISCRMWF